MTKSSFWFLIIFSSVFLSCLWTFIFYGFKCSKRTRIQNETNVADHKIIKQRVKLAEGKIVDLEIRVKVMEDKDEHEIM